MRCGAVRRHRIGCTACCGRMCAWTAHAEESLQKIGRSTYRGSKIVCGSVRLGRKDGTRWTHREPDRHKVKRSEECRSLKKTRVGCLICVREGAWL